jgi:hypothetical protein
MILKLRVPDHTEKHLISEFAADGKKLWADLTLLRHSFGYGEIPVYIMQEDGETLNTYGFFDAQELIDMGLN